MNRSVEEFLPEEGTAIQVVSPLALSLHLPREELGLDLEFRILFSQLFLIVQTFRPYTHQQNPQIVEGVL
jgi:hypothetical protein